MSKNTGNNMGRPIKEIDMVELKKLCQLQATLTEIAGWFDCSEDTIENRVKQEHKMTFSEYFKRNSAGGKVSLRRMQYTSAQNGSIPMQIWLGKQWLGQTEKVENKIDSEVNGININFGNRSNRDKYKDKDPLIVDGSALKDEND